MLLWGRDAGAKLWPGLHKALRSVNYDKFPSSQQLEGAASDQQQSHTKNGCSKGKETQVDQMLKKITTPILLQLGVDGIQLVNIVFHFQNFMRRLAKMISEVEVKCYSCV